MSQLNLDERRQLDLFRAVAEHSHAVIGVKDLEGRYLYINREYCRLFKIPEDSFLGHTDAEIFPPDIAFQFRSQDLAARNSPEGIAVEEQAPVDGKIRDYLSIKFPILDEHGEVYATGVIASDITELKLLQKRFQEEAEHDALTGCLSRRKLFELADMAISSAKRYHYPLAVLTFDIDNFKEVNDNYGHEGGDRVLQEFVKLTSLLLRHQDIFGRTGGEEFVAVLPHTTAHEAMHLAERIRKELQALDLFSHDHKNIDVTVSVGIAEMRQHHADFEEVLTLSDRALYGAKNSGRNCTLIYQ